MPYCRCCRCVVVVAGGSGWCVLLSEEVWREKEGKREKRVRRKETNATESDGEEGKGGRGRERPVTEKNGCRRARE